MQAVKAWYNFNVGAIMHLTRTTMKNYIFPNYLHTVSANQQTRNLQHKYKEEEKTIRLILCNSFNT